MAVAEEQQAGSSCTSLGTEEASEQQKILTFAAALPPELAGKCSFLVIYLAGYTQYTFVDYTSYHI